MSQVLALRCSPYLYDDEASAAVVGALKIDSTLVIRDVEALHGGSLPYNRRTGASKAESEDNEKRGELHASSGCKFIDV